MQRQLSISIREYVEQGGRAGLVPNNFLEFLSHIHRAGGFWQVIQRDKYTGRVVKEQWLDNAWTDNGVAVMLRAALGASLPPAFTPASILVISATLGATTLTANIPSGGTVSNITVAAPTGGTIPSGTNLIINPGANQLAVTLTQAINGAGTFTVTSVPGPTSQITSGSSVRYAYSAVPTADPTSLAAPASYTSFMPAGQFTYTGTTGYGNRQMAVTNNSSYLFSTTGSPAAVAGSYTEAWMANSSPISTNNQTVLRVALDTILTIDSTHNGEINLVEKL